MGQKPNSVSRFLEIPLIIIFLFLSAYGLVLTNAWVVDVTTFASDGDFAKVISEKHTKKFLDSYKAEWQKKYPYADLESKQFKKLLALVGQIETNRLNKQLEYLSGRDDPRITTSSPELASLSKELEDARHEKILSVLGENKDTRFWILFIKGLLMNVISLIVLIFLSGKESRLTNLYLFEELDEDDGSRILVTFLPAVIFLVCQLVIFVKVFGENCSIVRVGMIFIVTVAIQFLFRCFVFVPAASNLHKGISIVMDFFSYHWVKYSFKDDIFNVQVLEYLQSKGSFFIVSESGAEKIEIQKRNLRRGSRGISFFERRGLGSVSLDKFYGLLTKGAKEDAFVSLQQKMAHKVDGYFDHQEERETINYLDKIIAKIRKDAEKKLAKGRILGSGKRESVSELMMASLATKALRSFRKELIAGSEKTVVAITDSLKDSLKSEICNSIACYDSSSPIRLPSNARFFLSRGKVTLFVMEQAPQIRTIQYCGKRFRLAFPYTVFIAVFKEEYFQNLLFFFSNKPLKTIDDEIFLATLNNIGNEGYVCMGSSAVDEISRTQGSLAEKAEVAVSCFWQTPFNGDLSTVRESYASQKQYKSYGAWERYSEKNSLFPLGVSFTSAGTLTKKLEDIFSDESSLSKNMLTQVDSWFNINESNLREQILKLWSTVELRPFNAEAIRNIRGEKDEEVDKIFGEIKEICLKNLGDGRISKNFVKTINKAVASAVGNDLLKLEPLIPLERKISFDELISESL
ncbi:MAG: hypothetical protein NT165_00575 [Candidatus Falkowbacteria bacterium]|nr:hypothetical protein [Candidatus Falkowbacteria bacterium]